MIIYTKPPHTGQVFFHVFRGSFDTLHTHDNYWEFVLVLDGKITHVVNGKKIELPKHSLCLIRPSDAHALRNDTIDASAVHLNLGVTAKHLQKSFSLLSPSLFEELSSKPLPTMVTLSPSKTLSLEKDAYKALSAEKHQFEQRQNLLFLDVLREFYANLSTTEKTKYSQPVTALLALFARHENMKTSLRELIKQTGYSYPHMNRLFTQEVGRTPSDFFRRKRFEYAKTLIADTNLPLAEIAFLIGYESYPHFSTAFKRYAGTSPGEYANGKTKYYTEKPQDKP